MKKEYKIQTKVVHSQSKDAWNIVGTKLRGKHKIARIPYIVCGNETNDILAKTEALIHAEFISNAFNDDYFKTE